MAPGKGPLRIAIEDFLTGFGFGKRVDQWTKDLLESFELEAIDSYERLITIFGMGEFIPEQIKPASLRAMISHPIELLAVILPLLWQIISTFTELFVRPFMRPLGYIAEALAHTRHPDAAPLLQMIRKSPELENKLRSMLATTGYDQVSMDGFDALIDQYLGPADYQRLRLREALSSEAVKDKLTRLGYRPDDIAGLEELSKIIPTPGELVQMAVREAWNEETVSRFQYDAGFDEIPEFKDWMSKQGYSEDWTRRFWRAHWQLPGIGNAYEMLHRLREGDLATTQDDLETLLKTADIPEFWRKRLIAISYAPFTRIDIRRMWKLNILDTEGVYQAHLDLGYDAEHARKLTDFVTADQSSDKTDLTRSALIQAYKRGVMSREETKSGMLGIGMNDTDAEFYLQLADYDLQAQMTDIELQVIQAKYVNGTIDETGLAVELGRLNLPSERTTALQQIWNIQRTNKVNIPSRAELDDFLRRGIIDHAVYRALLARDGYEQATIDYFIVRVDQIIADDAAAELSNQQTEQERLNNATLRNSYQVNKASAAVAIAQLKSAIADITLAQHTITDPAQLLTMTQQLAEYKNNIVHIQEGVALLYQAYLNSLVAPGA